MKADARRQQRSDVFLIVEFRPFRSQGGFSLGISNNISPDGFSFEASDVNPEPGEVLEFRLKHPRSESFVEILGEVVWKRQAWYKCIAGVKYSGIDEEKKRMLSEMVSPGGHGPPESPAEIEERPETAKKEKWESPAIELYERSMEVLLPRSPGGGESAAPEGAANTPGDANDPDTDEQSGYVDTVSAGNNGASGREEDPHGGMEEKETAGDTAGEQPEAKADDTADRTERPSASRVLVAMKPSGPKKIKQRAPKKRAWLMPVVLCMASILFLKLGVEVNKALGNIYRAYSKPAAINNGHNEMPAVYADDVQPQDVRERAESGPEGLQQMEQENSASPILNETVVTDKPPLETDAPKDISVAAEKDREPVTPQPLKSILKPADTVPDKGVETPPGPSGAEAAVTGPPPGESRSVESDDEQPEIVKDISSAIETEHAPVPQDIVHAEEAPAAGFSFIEEEDQEIAAENELEELPGTGEPVINNNNITDEPGLENEYDDKAGLIPTTEQHKDGQLVKDYEENRGIELLRYKEGGSRAVRSYTPRIPNVSLVVTGEEPEKP